MKLRDLKGERAIEVIADLIVPVANIASDPKNKDFFRMDKQAGEDERTAAARALKEKTPILLKDHKADILAILSTVNGCDPNELSLLDIINGVVELANDQDFLSLFLSAGNQKGQTLPSES